MILNFIKKLRRVNNNDCVSAIKTPASVFLIVVLASECIAIAVMQGFVTFYHSLLFSHCGLSLQILGMAQSDLISHGIYIITPIYQLFLYIDAITQQNVFQLYMLLLFGLLVVIFTAIQTIQHMAFEKAGCVLTSVDATSSKVVSFVEISDSTTRFKDDMDALVSTMKPLDYSMLVVVVVSFLLLAGASLRTHFKANHHLFHKVLEKRLRNALIAWSILTSLLKIDGFFLFVYAVQLVPLTLLTSDIPVYESIVLLSVSLVVFLVATHATRNENTKALTCFCIVLLAFIGYFGFRLYTFGKSETDDPFKLTRYDLLFTTLTLSLLMIMTLCTCIICIRNISYKKLRILSSYQCICPTCFAHSDEDTTSTHGKTSLLTT